MPKSGRFLNQRDLDEQRKVAVIGEGVVEQLYEGADPTGTYIEANGVYFQVVGVFGSKQTDHARHLSSIDEGQAVELFDVPRAMQVRRDTWTEAAQPKNFTTRGS